MKIGVANWYSEKGKAGEEKIFPNFTDAKEYIQKYGQNSLPYKIAQTI